MSELTLVGEPRTVTGKKVKNLRAEGLVPGVVYGKGRESQHIQLNDRALRTVFRNNGTDKQYTLTVGDSSQTVIVQELQRHVTRGDLLHIDLLVVE